MTAVTEQQGASAASAALQQTLPGRLAHFARTRGNAPALREKRLGIWREITWNEYFAQVRATAMMLRSLGVKAGDHVSILSDNRPEWLYADLAAQSIGARSVGIYQTNPPEDVAYILNHSGSVVVFCEDQEQVDKVVAIRDETPSVKSVVAFDARGLRGYDDPRLLTWDEFMAAGRNQAAQDADAFEAELQALDPVAPSMVVYTSGTTGNPKGALLSSSNVVSPSVETVDLLGFSAEDSVLSYLPLCHVAEKIFSLFLPLSVGAVVHFGEAIETVQEDLRQVSPTVFLGVPRIWEKMHAGVTVKMRDSSWLKRSLFDFWTAKGRDITRRKREGKSAWYDGLLWWLGDLMIYRPLQERLGLRRCRLAISGAAPISPELIEWFEGIGVSILEGYGQTEGAGVSHINLPHQRKVGTVGPVLPACECRIADDGEILVRGANVFVGYLHNPEATASTIDAEGWLHTGDIGEVDEDGFLRITGRKKEIIITSGGKNLSPEKIENTLKMSPYIKEAIAVGDGRNFVTALIQIEYDVVGAWATRQKLTFTSYPDLAGKEEVVKLIRAEVDAANERMARVESVRDFRLLPQELSQDEGELTATQKVRRRQVLEIYSELIETMYGRGGNG